MALTVSGFSSSTLDYKAFNDTAVVNVMVGNVTGTSGTLYSLDVTNGVNALMYLKIYLDAAAVLSGDPDIKIQIVGSTREVLTFPGGIPFTELSYFATTTIGTSGSPSAPGGTVSLMGVTS